MMQASSSNQPPPGGSGNDAAGKDVSHLYVFTNEKGGMQGYNKQLANDVIYEMSKGSKHLAHAQKQDEKLDKRIEDMMSRLQFLTSTLRGSLERQWNQSCVELEESRDLSRVCAVLDMDMFFAAVELQDRPDLVDKPMAVGGMGMLSTANYVARRYGVRSAMPGFIAKELCQRQGVELHIIPSNFEKYQKVSAIIRDVVGKFGNFSMGSLDEAFIDLTDEVQRRVENSSQHVEGMQAHPCLPEVQIIIENITREMRAAVTAATGLTCSCGVGPNFMLKKNFSKNNSRKSIFGLAKTAADVKKPDGQTITPWDKDGIIEWLGELAIRKVGGVGKVMQKMLNSIQVDKVADISTRRAEVLHLFSAKTGEWLQRVSLGLSHNTLSEETEDDGVTRKSLSQERTFKNCSNPVEIENFLISLAEDVADEMQKDDRNLKARTVTIKLKKSNFDVLTRAFTCPRYINKKEELIEFAMPLLRKEFPCELRLLGLKVSNFQNAAEELPQGQKRLTSFFQKGNNATRVPARPLVVQNSSSSNLNLKMNLKKATPAKEKKLDQFFIKNPGINSKNNSKTGKSELSEKKDAKVLSPRHPSIDVVSDSESESSPRKSCGGFDGVGFADGLHDDNDFDCGSSQGSWVDMLTQSASYNTDRRMSVTSQLSVEGVTMFGNSNSEDDDEDEDLARKYQISDEHEEDEQQNAQQDDQQPQVFQQNQDQVEAQPNHVIESFVTAVEPNSDAEGPYTFHFSDAVNATGGQNSAGAANDEEEEKEFCSQVSWVEPPPTQMPSVAQVAQDQIDPQVSFSHAQEEIPCTEEERNEQLAKSPAGGFDQNPIETDSILQNPIQTDSISSKPSETDSILIRSQEAIANTATPRKIASDQKKIEEGLISPATNIKIKYESIPLADDSDCDGGAGGGFGGADFKIDEQAKVSHSERGSGSRGRKDTDEQFKSPHEAVSETFRSPKSCNSRIANEKSPSIAVLSDTDTPFKKSGSKISGGGNSNSALVAVDDSNAKSNANSPTLVSVVSAPRAHLPSSSHANSTSNVLNYIVKQSRRGSTNSTISNGTKDTTSIKPWSCESCGFRHIRFSDTKSLSCIKCRHPAPHAPKSNSSGGYGTNNAALRLARAKSSKRERETGKVQKITKFLKRDF